MADSKYIFSINFHHGGKMVEHNGELVYCGGDMTPKHGLDIDRFGYFDLQEEVNLLGYTSWDGLFYKIPRAKIGIKQIFDDVGVMDMIKHSNHGEHLVLIYVENGKKDVDVEHTNDVDIGVYSNEVGAVDLSEHLHANEFEGGVEAAASALEEEPIEASDLDDYSEDEDYMPIEMSDSDDGLSEADLDTDDEEYVMARQNRANDRNRTIVPASTNDVTEGYEGGHLQSDYEESEGEVNSESSNSENEPLADEGNRSKMKKHMIIYDPKCDHSLLNFVLGMRFESQKECRLAIQRQAIFNGYDIQFKRTNKKQIEARCVEGCPFSLYASLVTKEGRFAIKQLVAKHGCSRNMRTRQASARWIANEYIENFRNNPNWKIEDLAFDLNKHYAVQPSKWKLYRGKWMALELLRGSVSEHYGRLRSYMAALIESDNEGRFEFMLGDDSVFQRFYVGFSALKKGFLQGCRRIIGFDGCFLKTFLGGALLCATGKDGNNQMFPIAWAVVEAENESCWRWFFAILFEELDINQGVGWTFVSDQQKGLTKAISELTPFAEHRNCARHIYMNWKKQFKGQTLKNMFWRCVRSTNMGAYNISVQEMRKENEAAYQAFLEIDTKKFCKAFISTMPKSDMVDNNVSETFNGNIVKARAMHIIDMLETIRTDLMARQHENLHAMSGVIDKICPRIRKKIEATKYMSRMCVTKPAVGEMFQVSHEEDRFVVDLKLNTCTCRVWNLTGVPCIHACSAIVFMKRDVADYVDECYTISTYIVAYQNAVQPLNGRRMWPETTGTPIQPPLFRRMPGRPKKKRRRGVEEERRSGTKLKRFGLQMTCQKCLQTGHNKRTCTNAAVEKPQKRKRGRPRTEGSAPRARQRAPQNSSRSEITSQSDQTDNQNAYTSAARARDRTVARKGFGIHVSTETGNIYMKMPGEKRVHFVPPAHVGSSSRTTTRRRGKVNPGKIVARDALGSQESVAK